MLHIMHFMHLLIPFLVDVSGIDNSVSCMGLFGHSANKRLAFEKAQLMAFNAIQLNKLIMHSIVLDIIKTYMYAHEIVNRQVTNDVY